MTPDARADGWNRGLVATARADNWWSSKLPPLFAVAYAHLLRAHSSPAPALEALVAALIALCAVAWHAHVVNDLCDIDDDRRAGKPNRMAGMSSTARWGLVVVLPLVGLGAAISPLVATGSISAWVLAANFAVFALYSVPPVRLKIRRWWGVVADAVGAHALPTLFVLSAMPGGLGSGISDTVFAASALLWSLAAGLRGIIVHQFRDRDADRAAGLSTVGTTTSLPRARRLVMRVLLPVEVVGLLVFVGLTIPVAPLLAVAGVVYAIVEFDKIRRGWILPLFEAPETSTERYRPLLNNDVHELWLPNVLALQLGALGGHYLALPVLQIVLFLAATRRRVRDVMKLVGGETPSASLPDGVSMQTADMAGGLVSISAPPVIPEPVAPEIVIASTYWVVNGVNVFSANLARGLVAAGESARVLLTESSTRLVSFDEPLMPRPADVRFEELSVKPWESWGAHWGESIRYLESLAPCIYIPNSDWRHSSICPLLSDRVAVVGVVHSDDPLHYDHLLRLGPYWNAIVTVSTTLAERTAQLLPDLADRIHTIPIGVAIPDVQPERRTSPGEPLRIIYHGSLKVHQKRILDLLRVVEALDVAGVSVQLTIAGGGPDEQLLRERAETLVTRGLITILGVVAHSDIPRLLEQHDVYLLVSEFEGMPNALIEAMGHGLVPVVTRIPSGPSELVHDGENGFLVPVGDIDGFVMRLGALQREPDLRTRLAAAAFLSVRATYRVQDMVDDYRTLFKKVLRDVRDKRFVRPRSELVHAPNAVAGVKLFPVKLPYHAPGVGTFPSEVDYLAFRARVRRLPRDRWESWLPSELPSASAEARRQLPSDVTVVVGVPLWTHSGVNVQSEQLVRELTRRGIKAQLLLTEEHTDLVTVDTPRLRRPTDIRVDVLPVSRSDGWGAHWGATIRYLEAHAPCVYLPTFDWRHACVTPKLPRDVFVVGSVFINDAASLEQAERLADYWNAVVVPDADTADLLRLVTPRLDGRIATIADGASFPQELQRTAHSRSAMELLWHGDFAASSTCNPTALLAALKERGIMGRVSILENGAWPGPGRDDALMPDLIEQLDWPIDDHVFERAQAIVACVDGDTLPADVWRAMGWGCVPIFIHDGELPEYLRPGENCLAVRGGTAAAIADALAILDRDTDLFESLSLSAHLDARRSRPTVETTVDRYVDLFVDLITAVAQGRFLRPHGPMLPPPREVGGTGIFPVDLHVEVNGVGRFPSEADAEGFSLARAGHRVKDSTTDVLPPTSIGGMRR